MWKGIEAVARRGLNALASSIGVGAGARAEACKKATDSETAYSSLLVDNRLEAIVLFENRNVTSSTASEVSAEAERLLRAFEACHDELKRAVEAAELVCESIFKNDKDPKDFPIQRHAVLDVYGAVCVYAELSVKVFNRQSATMLKSKVAVDEAFLTSRISRSSDIQRLAKQLLQRIATRKRGRAADA